jgi:uncharacterized protein YjiS (DUF1127 family)
MDKNIRRYWRRALNLTRFWHERALGRRELARLCSGYFGTEFDLRDIGITRDDAQREAAKPFWRE